MRNALVCTHCFELTWVDVDESLHPRSWWTCTDCIPLGHFEGEDA